MTLADRLCEAERTATAIEPLSTSRPELGIDDAYAVQSAGRALRLAEGERIVGHKIGLTSKPMQEMVGVDQPDYGYLTDRMLLWDDGIVDSDTLVALVSRARSPSGSAPGSTHPT